MQAGHDCVFVSGPEYERMESFSNPMAPPEMMHEDEGDEQ